MPIILKSDGNLLDDEADALVNTVNCCGVSSGGIAKQFAKRFPENEEKYKKACIEGKVRTGRIFVTTEGDMFGAWHIMNFPTVTNPGDPAKTEDIRTGLDDLVKNIRLYKIKTVSVPAIGCGAGKLKWEEIKPLIENALGGIEGLTVKLYLPR
jgi:O-acetyl-ADP-ribose deacetylase (regulator of RNase III)